MGLTLAELGARMTSEEFSLHMALEVERQRGAVGPAEPESDWCDGM